jgi:predicted HTH transcriptional regulator
MRSLRDRVIVHRTTQATLPAPREPRIEDLIKREEGEFLEFKSSLMWDYQLNKPNQALELAVAKDLSSFMNTRGGTLIIGVSNNGEVLGLDKDIACLTKRPDKDGYEQKLMGLFGQGSYLATKDSVNVHLSWAELSGKTMAVIKIDPSKHPVYCTSEQKMEQFFIRAGNTCRPLNVREATEYIREHWKS